MLYPMLKILGHNSVSPTWCPFEDISAVGLVFGEGAPRRARNPAFKREIIGRMGLELELIHARCS